VEDVRALLDGELDEARRAAVDEHLATCSACVQLVAAAAEPIADEAAPAPQPREPAQVQDEARVDRYQLLEPIGAGGMGVVYTAWDPKLGRPIALKLLRGRLDDRDEARERLLREARAMARVVHPNVVAVHDAGAWRSHVFVAMELVRGRTLGAFCAERPRSWREVVDVFLAAGQGLAAAHAAGIVHRDFKPENVLVGDDGRARVTDFGLARVADELAPDEPGPVGGDEPAQSSPVLTRKGTIVGTPAYMAPEQMRGESADARADVFAFCVSLFESLLGERPFAGADLPSLRAAVEAGRVRSLPLGRAPPGLRKLLRRGLQARPEDRYATMAALLADLQRIRSAPRRWLFAGLAVLVIAASLALLVRRGTTWRAEVVPLPGVHEENATFPAISPDGKLIAYLSDRGERQLWRLYVEPLGGGEARALTPPGPRGNNSLHFTRDGRHILYIDAVGRALMRIPVSGGAPETVATDTTSVDDCGPSGLLLARSGAPDCPTCGRLVLLRDGREREIGRIKTRVILNPHCDARGERVVYAARNLSTTDLNLVTVNGATRTLLRDVRYLSDPVFSVDGRSVIYSAAPTGRSNLFEIDAEGGSPRQLTHGPGPDRGAAPTPDGKGLLFQLDDTPGQLFAIDLASGRRRRVSSSQDDNLTLNATFALDGRAVFAEVQRESGLYVAEVSLHGAPVRLLAPGFRPSPTPDDRELVYAAQAPAGRFRVEAVPRAGGPARVLGQGEGLIRDLVAGPDGRVHLALELGERHLAMSLPLAGGEAALDAPEPWDFLMPLAGGYQHGVRAEGYYGVDYILPPGVHPDAGPVDARALRILSESLVVTRDFRTVVYGDGQRIVALTPSSGERRELYEYAMPGELGLSPDGRTLLIGEFAGSARRELIRNFGDRPR
jgi:hypothetical protein